MLRTHSEHLSFLSTFSKYTPASPDEQHAATTAASLNSYVHRSSHPASRSVSSRKHHRSQSNGAQKTRLPTYPPIHSLPPTHSPTHSLSKSLGHSLTHARTACLSD